MSIFRVTDTPVLEFLVMSPLGFKARVGSLFRTWQRFTSGATPLPVYMATILASCFPHMHVSAEVGCQTQMGDLLRSSQTC